MLTDKVHDTVMLLVNNQGGPLVLDLGLLKEKPGIPE